VGDQGVDLLQRVDAARRGVRCGHSPDPCRSRRLVESIL
jgi:hypothetical protein